MVAENEAGSQRVEGVRAPFAYTLAGVLLVIPGLIGLFNPFAAQMSFTLFLSWLLIFCGAFGLYAAIALDSGGSRIIGVILGILTIIAGIFAIANPMSASVTLTIIIIAWLSARGIIEVVMAITTPLHRWWTLAMGALDLLLAFLLWRAGPLGSVAAVGFYVAISLIFWGVWNLIVSYRVRKVSDKIAQEVSSNTLYVHRNKQRVSAFLTLCFHSAQPRFEFLISKFTYAFEGVGLAIPQPD